MVMAESRDTEAKEERDEEKEEKVTPAPAPRRKHRRKHWDHLPGSKKRPIKSYKSPGRK
jgi:hypothetical protein